MENRYAELLKPEENPGKAIERLYKIVSILRLECPWDKVQTHETLTKCMIEEAYEAVDAINKEDTANMREELGDVLLQVVFHSNLADEEKKFTFTDVINEECEKMIRRHPHVFGEVNVDSVSGVLENWENIKRKEHKETNYTQRLKDVPDALPALIRSAKVQKRAADVGFDWDDIEAPIEKVKEEYGEFIDAYRNESHERAEEELGDLLFAIVNVSRFAKIDAEEALRKASDKFTKRFEKVEEAARAEGKDLKEMDLESMDALWNQVKKGSKNENR